MRFPMFATYEWKSEIKHRLNLIKCPSTQKAFSLSIYRIKFSLLGLPKRSM